MTNTKRYTDLYHLKNEGFRSPGRLTPRGFKGTTTKKNPLFRSLFFILSTAILIYGVKLFITPAGKVLGSFLSSSATTISLALSNRELLQDNGITNFLITGIDRRSNIPYSYQGASGRVEKNSFNTDTIIVGSFNKKTATISLLSVPRDLWVTINGFGQVRKQQGKINSVMALGDEFDYPGGGMALLVKVLEENLGIPIHYWARLDFEAFEKMIDTVGGVDVAVDRSFDDFMYPVYGKENASWDERFEHLHFDQGLVRLNGSTALKFARSREALGPEGSDFARAKRQHKVMAALKDKVFSADTFFDLTKLKSLYDLFTNEENIATNVDVADLPLFYNLAQKFSLSDIKSYVLDNGSGPTSLLYHPNEEQFGGAWVLLPKGGNFDEIKKFVRQAFYAPAPTDLQ